VINLGRDPRWGRNGEAGPECPYLMSQYSSSFTLGFQRGEVSRLPRNSFAEITPNPPLLRGVVTIKHWDGNSLEDSDGFTRHTFNDNVSDFVLADSYFPAFRRYENGNVLAQLLYTKQNICHDRLGARMGRKHDLTCKGRFVQWYQGGCCGRHVRVQLRARDSILHVAAAQAATARLELQVIHRPIKLSAVCSLPIKLSTDTPERLQRLRDERQRRGGGRLEAVEQARQAPERRPRVL
jgi:hypothetical protein